MNPIRRSWVAGLLLAAVLPTAALAEDDYPKRPIRVLVAFPAGGSADIVARLVTQKVGEMTGYNFVVDNRPGAGGNLAFDMVATAPADGYTLLFSTPGVAINLSLYSKVAYKINDFKGISLVGEAPLVLLARPSLGVHSIDELVKMSKRSPDAVRFASSGNGSSSHLAAEVLRSMSGLQYLHVPYKGGGAAITDVIGKQLDITVQPISESMPFIRNGSLLALGQTGRERSSIAPDIPTIEEGGVKGYSVTTWYMLLGPAKLPKDIVDKLAGKFNAALNQPELRDKLKSIGVSIINGGVDQTGAFLHSETDRWAKAIKTAGIKID